MGNLNRICQRAPYAGDPLALFWRWFDAARRAGEDLPEAMTLATVGKGGLPSARVVLMKAVEEGEFVFYTNYESRKGRELNANPAAALVFHWGSTRIPRIALERLRSLDFSYGPRQVRVEGRVRLEGPGESDRYWASRPRGSQIGAWASRQSRRLKGREELERELALQRERFRGVPVPRPQRWGGYRLQPSRIEFWEGRQDRLHDRVLYLRGKSGWSRRILAP